MPTGAVIVRAEPFVANRSKPIILAPRGPDLNEPEGDYAEL